MYNWMKGERCKVCKDERAVRYCLRKNKDIGWKCCNDYRFDGKCPKPCNYTPVKVENSVLPQIKADSRTELIHFFERYLQNWIYTPIPDLENQTAQQLCETEAGKEKLKKWLLQFSYAELQVLVSLNDILKLNISIPPVKEDFTDEIASHYLEAVISRDWEKVFSYHSQPAYEADPDLKHRLISLLSDNHILKKAKSFSIINSGYSEDHTLAFVFCEINGKENWTFIFQDKEGRWKIHQLIWGTIQDFYAQKQLFRDIAVAVSQNKPEQSWELMCRAKDIYPVAADIEYYFGLYYYAQKDFDKAKVSHFNAIAIDPVWKEPIFQLGFLYMMEKAYQEALTWWLYLQKIDKDDINMLNNLGVCYLQLEDENKARQCWEAALALDPTAEIVKKNLARLTNG